MRKRIKRKIRRFYRTFISLKGDPHRIAMGMAMGVFIGITPTIPFHTALVFLLVLITRQNFTAAMLGTWISNPLTIPFLYWGQYKIGDYLLGMNERITLEKGFELQDLLHAGWKIFVPMQLGGLIMAPLFAIPAYYLTYKVVLAIRRKRAHAHRERAHQEV